MKKILSVVMSLLLIMSLVACGSGNQAKTAEAAKEAEALAAEALRIKREWEKAYNDLITSKQINMEYQIRMKELEIEEKRVERWNGQYVSTNNYGPIPVAQSSLQWR